MKETQHLPEMPTLTEADIERADPRFLEVLVSLNEIGAAINGLTPQGSPDLDATLRLIAESVTKIVPDAGSVIYAFRDVEPKAGTPSRASVASYFSDASRISADQMDTSERAGASGPGELGIRAICQRRRVISYEEPDLDGVGAVVGFPLVVANKPLGVLYVYGKSERRFSQFELLILDNLVHQAAMAIYQARRLAIVQRDLVRTEDALKRLWHAGMLISSRLGLDETLEAILQMALEVTGAHHGIVRLVDEGGRYLITQAIAGAEGRPQIGALEISTSSIMGWVAEHRESLCIHDLDAAPWVRLYHPLDADLRMRSELAVPLISPSGRLEGVLNLESPRVGAFSEQHRQLLESLATYAVIAIQEARLIDALLEIAHLLLVEPCQQVLQRLVAMGSDLLTAAAGAIWILEGNELVLRATTEGWQRGDRLPLDGSLMGVSVINQAPVISEDVRQDERFYRRDLAQRQNWTRALAVPILSSEDGEAMGALSVYGTQGDLAHFTESEWDKKVLTCLAYYAALALHNAERQSELRMAQERHAVAETFAAVGDVAANVLHHLNNKVGTIPVRAQGIQDKCASSLAADDYLSANLAEIERSAREAMDAVRDSLSHLRPIHPAPVSVAQSVAAALEAARLRGDIEIRVEHLEDLPSVVASEHSLAFVFTNLIENAAEALEGEGVISIRGKAADSWIEVEIHDDGPGIVPELHGRIFEFDSFSGAGSHRQGRLGFGLWWVKTLLMRLGGSVRVQSNGVMGTTFQLRIPRAEEG
ncbi:MAG: GAF domain-containing protein [Anaerolineae bacterium]